MTLQGLLASPKVIKYDNFEYKEPTPRIVCMDGTSLSVQASEMTYCSPRENYGPYYKVEVGFPSRRFEELMPYIDGADGDPTATVYGYVPIEVVENIIEQCGGICIEMTVLAKGSKVYS
jgi:hypothetical protein